MNRAHLLIQLTRVYPFETNLKSTKFIESRKAAAFSDLYSSLCSFKFKLSNVKSFVPVISEQVEWISTRGEFVWEENGGRGSDASRFAIWRPCPGIWETRRRHRSPRLRGTERGGGAVGAHEARREG